MTAEKRLNSLGLVLPSPPGAVGNYVTVVRSGNLVYTSGHIPVGVDLPGEPSQWNGTLGESLDTEAGYRAARAVTLLLLSSLRNFLGDLDRVSRVVKVTGFVQSSPDFHEQPQVLNGASDLLVELFGDAGKHARSAVGVAALPKDVPVEIELIVEVSGPPREAQP
jgi:enamine deaminase RidA (YjgF/YER057c/UK114 family)